MAIRRCKNCGHAWSERPQPDDYDGYFGYGTLPATADTRYWDNAHAAMYDDFCSRFIYGRSGRLLDMGCGLGFFLKHMTAYPAWECQGCELSAAAADYARSHLRLTNVHNAGIEAAPLLPSSFDIITLWDVIEHIPSPDPVLSRLNELLCPRGFLFIHTPNAAVQIPKARLKRFALGMKSGVHYLEARDHCHIYTPASMHMLLERNGYKNIAYVHLRPISGMSGRSGFLPAIVKSFWHTGASVLDRISRGRINADNLFVIARKSVP